MAAKNTFSMHTKHTNFYKELSSKRSIISQLSSVSSPPSPQSLNSFWFAFVSDFFENIKQDFGINWLRFHLSSNAKNVLFIDLKQAVVDSCVLKQIDYFIHYSTNFDCLSFEI